MDNEVCVICGETMEYYFGRRTLPLCNNSVCETTLIGEINEDLGIKTLDKYNEGAVE